MSVTVVLPLAPTGYTGTTRCFAPALQRECEMATMPSDMPDTARFGLSQNRVKRVQWNWEARQCGVSCLAS